MADGSLRSVDWHANLVVPAIADAEPATAGPSLAAARLRIVLSEATDLWGVQPSGWLAALLLFAAIAAGGVFLPWRLIPPPAWPADPVRFRVVFEEPAPVALAPETAAPPATLGPPSVAPAELPAIAPAPETAVTEADVEPEPPPIATAPAIAPLPKPPVRKPPLHQASPPPPTAASHPVVAENVPTTPTAQNAQVAAAVAPVARGLSSQPSLAYGPMIDYPAAARMRGLQGRVLLRVDVSANGKPADVAVIASSGHVILDRAAIAMVREHWRFRPAMRDGVPVDGQVEQPVVFRLED
jgi:periplasmic protein TonB